MDLNPVRKVFTLLSLSTGIIGMAVSTGGNYLPDFITSTYRYGKYTSSTQAPIVSKFEVPKRWFRHFYEFAAPVSSIVLGVVISRYIFHYDVPAGFLCLLDQLFGDNRQALVTPECTLLATLLLTIQCWKRLYESTCVSVFSDARMNICHYLAGFVHYTGVILSLVGESDGFVRDSNYELDWSRVTSSQWACAAFFLWASHDQLRSNIILANLRKDKHGNVVTKSYKIPYGRLFKFISAPLQLTEIIMYSTLVIILWDSVTYHYVYVWVFVNQTETAILTHQWYCLHMKGYPKDRKVLIPFFY